MKIAAVKVTELTYVKDIDEGVKYKVEYKYGLNLFNPLSWLYIIFLIIYHIFEVIKEIIDELKLDTYSDYIKIKNEKS